MGEFMDKFVRASKVVRAASDMAVRRHGLHLGQNMVLIALRERNGQTPGDIATLLNVTTPTVVKMATRMTTAGLLTRRRDDPDNRLVRLYLTDAGLALCGPVEEELNRLEAHISAGLTDEELKVLIIALDRIGDNALTFLAGSRPESC
ncbi:MAG: MarR family transcriptional regulator [Umezawaea sp.]